MKKCRLYTFISFLVMFSGISCLSSAQDFKTADKISKDSLSKYRDGTYHGQSRASYTGEPYWGSVQITLKNGFFTNVIFTIRDSALHETFDGNYEKHFYGNPVYIRQSRNDWNGVQAYPKKLSELQDINKVDAISGATWSYNIFRESVNEALRKAK
jgi:uncharacterized protein with FMN-binding domain